MTTVTIHAEDAFAAALREYADRLGKSVNQTVKDLLSPILGLIKVDESDRVNRLPAVHAIRFVNFDRVNRWKAVYGCVPKEEADAVRNAIAAQHSIDEEMWR